MADIIEIVRFRLAEGTTHEAFDAKNREMEHAFLGHLHGFKTRDTARSEDGDYVVVLHWETAEDAQSSMDKFIAHPDTKAFTDLLDMDTFTMTRYTQFDSMTLADV